MKILPTLRQLRYLVAVAEHRHFGRAAEACLVTQSTLSAGVQELETLLGVTLIARSKRHVAMTPLGEDIVARARALLQAAEEMADVAMAGSKPLSGLLRLGVLPTIAPYLLPRALPAVRAAYPNLRLYLREEQTAMLIDNIWHGRLDAAVIALPYDCGNLKVVALGEDRLLIACALTHPFAGRATVQEEELKGERLLLMEDGHCLRDHVLTACRLLPGRPNEDMQGTSLGTLTQMVANGLGLTLLPEMAVPLETSRLPGIAVVPFAGHVAGHGPSRTIALAWRPGTPREPDLRLLADMLLPYVTPAQAKEGE